MGPCRGEMPNLDKFRKRVVYIFNLENNLPVSSAEAVWGLREDLVWGASPIWHSSRSWWQVGPV